MKRIFLYLCLSLGLLGLDQGTKLLADAYLKNQPDIWLIQDVFSLHYLENRGSAFGMLENQRIFFIIITVVVLIVIAALFVKLPEGSRYPPLRILLAFLTAGAIGNLIDRICYAYVIDFFNFCLINFPVFNVADIYITLGTIALLILLLFYYKEEDFAFLKKKQSRE